MKGDKSLEKIFQDESIVVVNKPGGLLAVPGRGPDKQDCVVRRFLQLYPDAITQPAVHRLDMATSGLMVLARTQAAHSHLSKQFSARTTKKRYEALLEGEVEAEQGDIRLAFRLDPDNRPYQIYDPIQGKLGITKWRKINYTKGLTRVEFFPETGRTHQLRLHASHSEGLGCPILGDSLYGNGKEGDRMFLHATGLQIVHPVSEQVCCFFAPTLF